jgi:hypothetical protein
MTSHVVLLTRGHGFGHAARDLLLINSIHASRPDVELSVAAAGSGTEFYRLNSVPCHDLGILDEEDTRPESGKKILAYLTGIARPDLVIVDELVWALPICRKVLGVDTVFITDWFYSELGLPHLDHTLNQTSAIMVPDFQDAHSGVTDITVPLYFPGPLVQKFARDRNAARAALGVPRDAFLVVVSLGGMPQRAEAQHIINSTCEAWQRAATPTDLLFIRADRDPSSAPQRDVCATWLGLSSSSPSLYSAADVVLVDGMGLTTTCELARNGTPTLAVRDPTLNGSTHARLDVLEAAGLIGTIAPSADPDQLWDSLHQVATRPPTTHGDQLRWADPADVTATILRYLKPAKKCDKAFQP